ncbi:hypothetical protein ACSV5G_10710 [Agrobacterium cavarae]|uniref:hypothetical protein n=1 Tax=Agrobacterium cavarae TaxID=2528239 RepID=UPI003FD091C5
MSDPVITIEGTTVRVLVMNKGDAPGMFVRAFVRGDKLAGATKIRLRDEETAIIRPGSNLLTFDVIPLLTEEQSYVNSIEMIQSIIQDTRPSPTDLIFNFGDSDGSLRATRLQLDGQSMFDLMRSNADRCSAIEKPDFNNGCIGPGQIK